MAMKLQYSDEQVGTDSVEHRAEQLHTTYTALRGAVRMPMVD